jgi:hypothetical protein
MALMVRFAQLCKERRLRLSLATPRGTVGEFARRMFRKVDDQ